MGRRETKYGTRVAWIVAALLIVVLAFWGQHLGDWLPRAERWIESLGPWAPVAFVVAIVVLEPLLFPSALFGLAAGVVFGAWKGTLLYFSATYAASLLIYFMGRRILRAPVLRLVQTRSSIRDVMDAVAKGGPRLVFWIRILPVNPAVFSYALGAVRVPFRSVALGSIGLLPTMFFDVYFGAVAAHVTRMASQGHSHWDIRGAGLLLGLAAFGFATWRMTRIARAQIRAARTEPGQQR